MCRIPLTVMVVKCLTAGGIAVLLSAPAAAEDRIYFSRASAESKPGQPKIDIYSMAVDGSDQRQVSKGEGSWLDPAVSPDGKWLACAVVKYREGPPMTSIVVMNTDGSQQNTLVEVTEQFLTSPAWSPDGKQIAYSSMDTRRVDRGPPKSTIFTVTTGGKNRRELGEGLLPHWSPDGKQIAYTVIGREANRLPELHIMDADGKNSKRMVEGAGMTAVWSPDGKQIAFMSDGGNQRPDLFLMNADGSNKKQLTRTEAFELGPQWVSEGTRIVFTRMHQGDWNTEGQGTEVFSIKPDGRDEKQLTKNNVTDATPGGALFLLMRGGERRAVREKAVEKQLDK